MNRSQLRAFLIILMKSDQFNEDEQEDAEILNQFANEESMRHGFGDWIEAYHKLIKEV